MKNTLLLFILTLLLSSCSKKNTLSNEEASIAINNYYSKKGCFSKMNMRKIGKLDIRKQEEIEAVLKNLNNGDQYKAIAWKVGSINGVMVSDDGNSATVDFTLTSQKTDLYQFQKYITCGDTQSDFGPWQMVAEFTKYDTGWKVKSQPKSK